MSATPEPSAKLPANGPAPGEPRPPLQLSELGEILVRAKLLTPQQAKDVEGRETTLRSRVLKERVGSVRSQAAARYDVSAAEIVAAASFPHAQKEHRRLDEDAIAQCIAGAANLRYLKIDPLKLDNALISKTFSRPFVRRHVVIPIGQEPEGLVLAVADPFDTTLRETLQDVVRKPFVYAVTSKKDILSVADRVFGLRTSIKQAVSELGAQSPTAALVQLVNLRSNEELATANDETVVAAVDFLLNYAFEQRASDIHLEPRAGDACVRFRIDGILHDIEAFPIAVHNAIVSRVKVMARMDIAERRRPQDGRIKTKRGQSEIELRVASIPTAFGEKVVVRILDPSILMADLADLGFAPSERELYEKWITSPSGLILVTGPTGSGKTTTLYATLRYLAGPEVNITTVEEPIEMIDPRFVQVQVQRKIELTFAAALRAMLRQDPDIIMVGENRDAAGAVTRLAELGVERFLLSSVLRGVLAQRLLRRICSHCAVDGHLTPDQVAALGIKVPVERRERLAVRWGEGCVECRHTGLYGRTGVFELLNVARRVRELVKKGEDATEIARAAKVEGMESLRESALRRLAEGVTTYEEVIRVTADMD